MIQTIQMWIWNIGGCLFTILVILAILTYISSYIVNRLSWWYKKESRENLFYWLRNKERINEIVEKEKNK